jgi:hypothetical protein
VRARVILPPDLALPIPTISCARGADPIGDFGLVRLWLTNCYHDLRCAGRPFLVGLDPVTNPYQVPDLARPLPSEAFTNHYHRDGGPGDTEHIAASRGHQGTGWCGSCRVIQGYDGGGPYGTLDVGQNGGTRARSVSRRKNLFHQAGRLAFLHPWW